MSNSNLPILAVLACLALAVVLRLLAGAWDRTRVREYIESRGGSLGQAKWAPFGRGWFGDERNRIYDVDYTDGEGREHRATCKTSLFGGVYFTEDDVVGETSPEPDVQANSATPWHDGA